MEHVKIQINSNEALNRLVGDNPEIRLELKDRLVATLIKDHIQPLLGVDNYNNIMREVMAEVEKLKAKHVNDVVAKKDIWGSLKLQPEIVQLIKTSIDDALNKLIVEKLTSERHNIETKLNDILTKNRENIAKYIRAEIDNVIHAQLDDRLKVVLDHISQLSKFYAIERAGIKDPAKDRKITLEL